MIYVVNSIYIEVTRSDKLGIFSFHSEILGAKSLFIALEQHLLFRLIFLFISQTSKKSFDSINSLFSFPTERCQPVYTSLLCDCTSFHRVRHLIFDILLLLLQYVIRPTEEGWTSFSLLLYLNYILFAGLEALHRRHRQSE